MQSYIYCILMLWDEMYLNCIHRILQRSRGPRREKCVSGNSACNRTDGTVIVVPGKAPHNECTILYFMFYEYSPFDNEFAFNWFPCLSCHINCRNFVNIDCANRINEHGSVVQTSYLVWQRQTSGSIIYSL